MRVLMSRHFQVNAVTGEVHPRVTHHPDSELHGGVVAAPVVAGVVGEWQWFQTVDEALAELAAPMDAPPADVDARAMLAEGVRR